ncbi:CAP domain-containing protein [Alphaproteobacteria bacterium GH1-50]|uniref:CAP domain-containing protein n=1 Tax=Kangsaoukella pontilimi TaxID=2691042 RepID=A0A7C9MK67_9RHOB|nr:CAP domain-containing protein [Kangsaoukella pontilimi]MXQ08275.1 CAP domain-containing protein [Kangsaoukella pontilimi]
MLRKFLLLIGLAFTLTACATPEPPRFGPDGRPLPQIYRIDSSDTSEIQFRVLDGVNALRAASGAGQVKLSAELNAAAATHAQDMSLQNRPWHFGSDGSSPLDRVQRAGYRGGLLGENISETYESELETLAAWMTQPDTRGVILDPRATDLGIAWFQEPSGKIWWTLITGQASTAALQG